MGFNFQPEDVEAINLRMPAALERLWDQEAVRKDVEANGLGAERPGADRKYIFDYPDGMRLIVSREKTKTMESAVHISATLHHGLLVRLWVAGKLSGKQLQEMVRTRIRTAIGVREIELVGISDMGVAHWQSVRNYYPSKAAVAV